jgi:hypothetical protein
VYLNSRGIQFVVLHGSPQQARFDLIELSDVRLFMRARYYDGAIMSDLARRSNVRFLDANGLLALATKQINAASCKTAHVLLDTLDRYYFRPNPEAVDSRRILAAAARLRCSREQAALGD